MITPAYTRHPQTNAIPTTIIRQTNIHGESDSIKSFSNSCPEKKPIEYDVEKHTQIDQDIRSKKPHYYLSAEKIKRMLMRFLTETQIPKEKLAESLGVTVKKLNWLCFRKITPALIRKINLPLIHLYCKTKFNN